MRALAARRLTRSRTRARIRLRLASSAWLPTKSGIYTEGNRRQFAVVTDRRPHLRRSAVVSCCARNATPANLKIDSRAVGVDTKHGRVWRPHVARFGGEWVGMRQLRRRSYRKVHPPVLLAVCRRRSAGRATTRSLTRFWQLVAEVSSCMRLIQRSALRLLAGGWGTSLHVRTLGGKWVLIGTDGRSRVFYSASKRNVGWVDGCRPGSSLFGRQIQDVINLFADRWLVDDARVSINRPRLDGDDEGDGSDNVHRACNRLSRKVSIENNSKRAR